MFRALAISLFVILSASTAAGQNATPTPSQISAGQSPSPTPSVSAVHVDSPNATGAQLTTDSARQRRDLRAQERMAEAADVQAREIVSQTPFIWAGTLLAGFAFAVSIAALWVSIGTERRQLRAYLMLDHIGLLHPTHDADFKKKRPRPLDQPILVVHVKNFGSTPATAVLHWADFEILPIGKEDGVPAPTQMNPISSGIIAPSGVLTKKLLFRRPVTPQEAVAISTGAMAFYARGFLTYKDAFKRDRETRFLMRYQGAWPPAPGAEFYYCDTGNSLT